MCTAESRVAEILLYGGQATARLICPPELIPAPGQYLLTHANGSDSPLPAPVFAAGAAPAGFLAAPPLPADWRPGVSLALRGPLGRGFDPPPAARRIALLALEGHPARLLSLLPIVLAQNAAVVLVCEAAPEDLPAEVEVQPPAALTEVLAWADYAAFDLARQSLPGLRERLGLARQAGVTCEAQLLVVAPMPCGGIADCGVCAVSVRRGWKMVCKDGPVFDLAQLF